MNNVKNALSRKLGPLPAWGWLVIFAGAVWFYRNRNRAGSALSAANASTQQPPQAPITLAPGESVYDPNSGALLSTPGSGGDTNPLTTSIDKLIALLSGGGGGDKKSPGGKKPKNPGGKRKPKTKPQHTGKRGKPKRTRSHSHTKGQGRGVVGRVKGMKGRRGKTIVGSVGQPVRGRTTNPGTPPKRRYGRMKTQATRAVSRQRPQSVHGNAGHAPARPSPPRPSANHKRRSK